jgi:hypothetical protein
VTRNPISLAGAALTSVSALLILTLFALGVVGLVGSPYLGILAFLILPAIFVVGLLLIPFGIWRQRRAERALVAGAEPARFPVIDLNSRHTQRVLLTVAALTAVNVIVISVATYKGVEVMDSTRFCGDTCHTVMQPEYATYQRSPHAHVDCVACHIGPGASWFVKSKLSGAWQVIAVTFNLYPRPIPTPVRNLRPARETCETCHWPEKFVGDRLVVKRDFASDENNTPQTTVLSMHVGGVQGRSGRGIHWHVAPGVHIRYRGNAERTTISNVELNESGHPAQIFNSSAPAKGGDIWRVMDCVDCHNRPTHVFVRPERAVDDAIALGRIPGALPFVRREGLRIIQLPFPSLAEAQTAIRTQLKAFYAHNYPQRAAQADVERAAIALADAYADNVFPSMKVGWGTYRSELGHNEDNGGCYRCHDGGHSTPAGESISQDCNLCHSLLAQAEARPAILEQLHP